MSEEITEETPRSDTERTLYRWKRRTTKVGKIRTFDFQLPDITSVENYRHHYKESEVKLQFRSSIHAFDTKIATEPSTPPV